jgi:hypothetical protein
MLDQPITRAGFYLGNGAYANAFKVYGDSALSILSGGNGGQWHP